MRDDLAEPDAARTQADADGQEQRVEDPRDEQAAVAGRRKKSQARDGKPGRQREEEEGRVSHEGVPRHRDAGPLLVLEARPHRSDHQQHRQCSRNGGRGKREGREPEGAEAVHHRFGPADAESHDSHQEDEHHGARAGKGPRAREGMHARKEAGKESQDERAEDQEKGDDGFPDGYRPSRRLLASWSSRPIWMAVPFTLS